MLDKVMEAAGIKVFGVADYEETLPGTGFKQREMFDGIQSVIRKLKSDRDTFLYPHL